MSKQFQGSTKESFLILSKELVNNISLQYGYQEDSLVKKSSYTNAQLLIKLYSIVISHRKDVCDSSSPTVKLNELEKIVWYSHILYEKRLFESANRLDCLFRTLKEKGLLTHHCDVRVVLQFLSNLIDARIYTKNESLAVPTPWKLPSIKSVKLDLPSGPLNYNDTCLHCVPSRWHYTHFPSRLFEMEIPNSFNGNCYFSLNLNHCQEEPGKGLQYNFFKIEERNSDNCLGALVGPKNIPISPDTELCIPDLPSIPDDYSFVPFFLSQYNDNLELSVESTKIPISSSLPPKGTLDEGYVSSQGSWDEKFSSSCNETWETVLKSLSLPDHYAWESAGMALSKRQKPFISEAGNEVTFKSYLINSHHLSILTVLYPNYPIHTVTSKTFCTDIIHLLMGIPSSCFIWNKTMKTFEVNKVIYCQGMTPESLYLQINSFLNCGNKVICLEKVVNQIKQHPEIEYGFVFRAFVLSIKNILSIYRKKVFSLLGEDKILTLKFKMEKLISKIGFLYNICFSNVIEDDTPFKGLKLIGALKNEFLLTHQKSNSFLLLSLLSASCQPFFRFLEKWIYEGELYDPTSEFMVCQNTEALESRDRTYWLKGHYFNHAFLKEIPDVLKTVLIQAFHCGKSLNFLQTFAPQSFLLQKRCIPFPKITLCMTINEVELTRKKCLNYFSQMENCNNCITLKKQDDLRAEKLHQLLCNYRNGLNTVPSHLQSGYLTYKTVEIEQKKKELLKIKADIEQAKMCKDLEEKKMLVEDLKTQNLYDMIQQEKDEEDLKLKNKLKNYHYLYMTNLEGREDCSRHRLKCFSDGVVEMTSAMVCEEDSPQTSQCSYIDTVSQMSVASDALDTPIMDEIPDILEDNNVHEANEMDNLVFPVIESYKEVNNNPLIESSEVVELEMIKDAPCGLSLQSSHVEALRTKSYLMNNCIKCSELSKNNKFTLYSEAQTNRENILREECNHIQGKRCSSREESLYCQNDYQKILNFPMDSLNGNYKNNTLDQDYSDIRSSSKSPGSNKNFYKANRPSSLSETEYFPDFKLLRSDKEEESRSSGVVNIRKSKSETFHVPSSDRLKGKGLQSSLSNLCESETPIIVDTMGGEVLKHRGRNIHGHVSDSVIQNILWRNTPNWNISDNLPKARFTDKDLLLSRVLEPSNKLLPYSTIEFCLSDHAPLEDISKLHLRDASKHSLEQSNAAPEPYIMPQAPIVATSTCLIQALSIHISTQTRLVNETVLSHILVHEQLNDHFSAIKSFLLLNDISFARSLASGLYTKFPLSNCMPMLCNPVNLNGLLHEAVAASQFAKSPFADNLSFVITNMTSSINIICNPFDHIQLHYQVKWPCCVILDDSVFKTYGRIWKFLIKLHFIIWTMDDLFKHIVSIDHDPFFNGIKNSVQFRKISIYRFEIHQFVSILFDYIVQQGIQSGWISFQSNLRKNVVTLDDLYAAHWDLLNNIIGKCFLTTQANIVQDILQSIFDKIISFRSILFSHSWMLSSATKQLEHPQFLSLQKIHQEIKQLSLFLNKLLLKILHWTYSDHLRDLVHQLSFNMNDQRYDSSSNILS